MARIIFLISLHLRRAAPFLLLSVLLAAPVLAADRGVVRIESSGGVHSFRVETMRTPEERAQGLMFRRHLDADAGMLFDFQQPMVTHMWMKNTYIPLDMMFIREDGAIANIVADTQPHSTAVLSSTGKVRYVLEVNAGTTARLGIRPGDRVILPD